MEFKKWWDNQTKKSSRSYKQARTNSVKAAWDYQQQKIQSLEAKLKIAEPFMALSKQLVPVVDLAVNAMYCDLLNLAKEAREVAKDDLYQGILVSMKAVKS